ncbi:MAG TPA: BrnT family toxin [Candidatus Acidoferrales bacterium]|nr:BrnT family toxin [Candidatus Acidoferrales bacterium]
MRFTWDENKNRRNRAKHGISFETAALVFDDPHAISRLERIEDGEERWQTLGLAGGIVVLLVAHTYYEEGGEEVIRIISARKATPLERKIYEEGI